MSNDIVRKIYHVRVWDGEKYVTSRVEINVDFECIANDLAKKAFHNKSKTAKLLKGAIRVKNILSY